MRNSCYFPSKVRVFFSDFAIMISIVIFTIIDILIGINTPKLNVPSTFRVIFYNIILIFSIRNYFKLSNHSDFCQSLL